MKRRSAGLVVSIAILFVSGAIGVNNGLREISMTLTPLQRSVSIGVLIYGIAGLAGGIALVARHPSAVWFATIWGIVVTYVSSLAAIAYAGEAATVAGAIASGFGAALIAVGVVWAARLATRPNATASVSNAVHSAAVTALVLLSGGGLGACRQLYSGPPVVVDRSNRDVLITKIVRTKREPDRLIAQDMSVCWVAPDVFASIRPGAHWRCDWRHVPEGQ